jgi:hypothetical protein
MEKMIGLAKGSKRHPLYCSFCGKRDADVGYLVSGPCVFICNECVEMCREIGQEILCETPARHVGNSTVRPDEGFAGLPFHHQPK